MLVSKDTVAIDTNFHMSNEMMELIRKHNGIFDRANKMWQINFFEYIKVFQSVNS